MDNIKKKRRGFLKDSLTVAAGLSAYSLLSSCTSFDEYLFEDRFAFNDEVMIIGGGISGLYLAHKLRSYKTEFRLFEGSATFGGRIRSAGGVDYGASLLSVKDVLANKLVTDLGLPKKNLDKDYVYLPDGMQLLTDTLAERAVGLIPYRNFRLRWRLIEIDKLSEGYSLVFESPSGQKKFNCKRLALTIPPTQWSSVKGLLELPEMQWAKDWLANMQVENTVKVIVPVSALPIGAKPYLQQSFENLNIRQVIKKGRPQPVAEFDVKYLSSDGLSIENIYGTFRKKMQIGFPFQKLTAEQYFDWEQVKLIKGSQFRNFLATPTSDTAQFQIVGDFTASSTIYTIEGALQSALKASELFI